MASVGRATFYGAWLAGIAACLAGGACESREARSRATSVADSSAGEVRFDLLGPGGSAIIVPAEVNGKRVELVLDTGATFTCVDEKLASELSLAKDRRTIASGVGAAGAGRIGLVRIDSLRVGAAVAKGLTACTLDLAQLRQIRGGVRGLLGLNFIRNYRLTLDFDRQVAQFTPSSKGL